MKHRFIFLIVLGSILIAVSPALAGVGTTGGNFLLLGGGARPLGMGEAFVALTDDPSAVYWNPAGLAKMVFPGLEYTYNQWFVDIKHSYFNYAFPSANGTLGIGYSLLDSGDIPGYSASGSPESSFKAQASALSLAWGRRLNDRFSAGVCVKTISESLQNSSATAIAMDGGLIFEANPRLSFGAAVQNLGGALKFVAAETPLPLTYRLGVAFRNRLFIEDALNLAADYVSSSGAAAGFNLGLEYIFRDLFSVRLGAAKGGLRAGVGLRSSSFGLDYAYLANNDLGAAHQLSMSYSFGSPDRKKALLLEYLTAGKTYYEKSRFADAVVYFRKVLALDPNNADGKALLTKANRALETGTVEKLEAEIKIEKESEVTAHLEAGKKYLVEKQYLEAITEFNKALKLSSSHPEAVKMVREAQAALEAEVTEKVADEAREHLGLALKYITTQQYSEALTEVQETLKIDPGNVQALKLYRKLQKINQLEKTKEQ